MPSDKLNRKNDEIQKILSNLLRSVKDPRVNQGGMISVTHVEVTGDLRYAKVWLSVLGDYDQKEFKRGLRSASGWLRRELGGALTLRTVPELVFEMDNSIEHGAHINRLLRELETNKTDEEGREDGTE